MKNKIYESDKTFIGRFSYNDDLLEKLNRFCNEHNIRTGWISVIGAVKKARLGYYNQEKHEYIMLEKEGFNGNQAFEIASSSGNISIKDGKPFVHLHMVVTDRKANAFGGHVMPETHIFAGEFIIQAFKGEDLQRTNDIETGLQLWQIN